MTAVVIVLALLLAALGLAGIVLPVLPGGSLLVGLGLLLLSIRIHDTAGWVLFAVAVVLLAGGLLAKWLLPSRSLRQAGVPLRTQVVGAIIAIVGFFVVPVIGFFLGFVLGVYVAELARLHDSGRAWRSTVSALKAAGLAILIELSAALCALLVYGVGAAFLA